MIVPTRVQGIQIYFNYISRQMIARYILLICDYTDCIRIYQLIHYKLWLKQGLFSFQCGALEPKLLRHKLQWSFLFTIHESRLISSVLNFNGIKYWQLQPTSILLTAIIRPSNIISKNSLKNTVCNFTVMMSAKIWFNVLFVWNCNVVVCK